MVTQEDYEWISVRLEPELKSLLEARCNKVERSVAQQVRLLIKEYLDKQEKKHES